MNDEGGVEKIDLNKVDWRGSREFFESLGDVLDKLDDHDESYDFTWVGKRKSIIEAGAPINKTLRPDVENSKNWDTTENLFIEGDNLDALKLLQESYLGKVKMIYIDPPYNTGKDFVYHDNFRADTEQYDEDTEYKDDEGNIQFKKNEKSNGRYHSDWLSMMYPRLKLARNLLSDDGVIFISIDDNEQANLKKLCDEVFGEDNFFASINWMARTKPMNSGSARFKFQTSDEYVLAYGKKTMQEHPHFNLEVSEVKAYTLDDGDGAKYRLEEIQQRKNIGIKRSVKMEFEIPGAVLKDGYRWTIGPDTAVNLRSTGELVIKNQKAYRKLYEEKEDSNAYTPLWSNFAESVGTSEDGKAELFRLLNDNVGFETVKPVDLVKKLAFHLTSKEDVIVDFFCGSGTSAHSVMQLNAEDGGNRKWIMVQLPEETDEKSEAFKAGYKTIPEISRERIRRAGDKIAAEHPDAKVDYGFRALRIDETNHKDVYRPAADYQQNMLDDLVDNIKEDRSELDLLYGVLSQSAFELNRPMETIQIDTGATLYKYDYFGQVSGLVACFDDEVTEETIKQIAQLKPLTAVFREDSFPNSQAKVNLAEHFRIISPDTKVKVI